LRGTAREDEKEEEEEEEEGEPRFAGHQYDNEDIGQS
jgi:hypothetical protein